MELYRLFFLLLVETVFTNLAAELAGLLVIALSDGMALARVRNTKDEKMLNWVVSVQTPCTSIPFVRHEWYNLKYLGVIRSQSFSG